MKQLLFSLKSILLGGILLLSQKTNAQAGAALNMDGTDAVSCGGAISASLFGLNKLTVEAWVKPVATGSLQNVVGNYNTGGGNRMQFLLRVAPTRFEFFIGNGSISVYTPVLSTVAPTFGVYQHIAGVWNGTVATIYVNGVASGSANIGYASFGNFTGANVVIGSNMIGENYNGDVDEVRIWSVARTKCELVSYKNCEIPTSATGLIANYHFNHGTAGGNNAGVTTLTDASGNGNNGTLTASTLNGPTSNWVAPGGVVSGSITPIPAPTVSVSAAPSLTVCSNQSVTLTGTGTNYDILYWSGAVVNGVPFTQILPIQTHVCTVTNSVTTCAATTSVTVMSAACSGTNAEALDFAGTNDMVNLGTAITSSLGGTNQLTVEGWFKPSTTANFQNLVGNYNTNATNGSMQFLLRQNSTNLYEFWIGNGAALSYTAASAASTPTLNVWQHVAGVYDGSQIKLYVNGVLKATTNVTLAAFSGTMTNPVMLGGNLTNEIYSGAMDEVRIWNVARTQCEINNYKNTFIPTSAPGLLANYHFNQGFAGVNNPTVNVLSDASGNNVNGTLTNFALTGWGSNWVFSGGVTTGTNPVAPPVINISSTNSVACVNTTQTITASGTPTLNWVGVCSNCTSTVATSASTTAITYTVIGTAATTCTNSVNFTQTFVSCTGIEELNDANNIVSVFPNPNNGQFTITLNTNATINIYNNIGQNVSSEKFESGNYSINLSHLSKGMYMIEAVSGNQRQMHKIIVE